MHNVLALFGPSHWSFKINFLGIDFSFSNFLLKVANSTSTAFSLSSLEIRVKKTKSNCLCFGAIAPYTYTHKRANAQYNPIINEIFEKQSITYKRPLIEIRAFN